MLGQGAAGLVAWVSRRGCVVVADVVVAVMIVAEEADGIPAGQAACSSSALPSDQWQGR